MRFRLNNLRLCFFLFFTGWFSFVGYTQTYTNGGFSVNISVEHPCDGLDNGIIGVTIISTINGGAADIVQLVNTSGPEGVFFESVAEGDTYNFVDQQNGAGNGLSAGDYIFTFRDDAGVIIASFQPTVDNIILYDLPDLVISKDLEQTNMSCSAPDGQAVASLSGGSLNNINIPGGTVNYNWTSDNGLTGLPLNGTSDGTVALDLAALPGVPGLPGGTYTLEIFDNNSVCTETVDFTHFLCPASWR